jgi:hypothetical protein
MKFRGRNKYGARRADGFGSKLERAVYEILLLREKAGEIKSIRRQHAVVLQEGKREVRISWKIDFSFIDCSSGKLCFCEAKGFPTNEYLLKLKMFRKSPQGRLEIWKGSYKKPFLAEVIE